jgi:sugar fermentation stimulation protein A
LLRRYKRFLADVRLENGIEVTAHCANPGAMLGLAVPGAEIWLQPSADPKRKLVWSWELEKVGGHFVGINTSHPNRLAAEAIAARGIIELAHYPTVRREVRLGLDSRIDLLLEAPGRAACYVEIKNVHLRRGDTAEFPDCVTQRGAKHLGVLADAVAHGHRAVMLYVVQRGDCRDFRIAADLDPGYAAAFAVARAAGVEAICYACDVAVDRIEIAGPLPLAAAGATAEIVRETVAGRARKAHLEPL